MHQADILSSLLAALQLYPLTPGSEYLIFLTSHWTPCQIKPSQWHKSFCVFDGRQIWPRTVIVHDPVHQSSGRRDRKLSIMSVFCVMLAVFCQIKKKKKRKKNKFGGAVPWRHEEDSVSVLLREVHECDSNIPLPLRHVYRCDKARICT